MTGGVFFTPRETSNGGECGKTTKGGKDIKGTSDIIVSVGTDEWQQQEYQSGQQQEKKLLYVSTRSSQ